MLQRSEPKQIRKEMNIPWEPTSDDSEFDHSSSVEDSAQSEPEEDEQEDATEEEELEEEEAVEEEDPFQLVHEELAAAGAEARRNARRLMEGMKQIGSALEAVSSTLGEIHRSVRDTAPVRNDSRPLHLGLVELSDRLERIRPSLAAPPVASASWWPGASKILQEWKADRARIADAFSIFHTHIHGLLKAAALERLNTINQPFDPTRMTAVEVVVDSTRPDHTVVAEILPGWHYPKAGEILRTAQVKVSRVGP